MADDEAVDDNPLEFITDDELFEELARRSTAVVLIWTKDTIEDADVTRSLTKGSMSHCIGLLRVSEARYMQNFLNLEEFDGE